MSIDTSQLPTAVAVGVIVALIMPAWLAYLGRRGIHDAVSAEKIHRTVTPRGGGAVVGAIWLLAVGWLLAIGQLTPPQAALLVGAPLILLGLGAADDLYGLSPGFRLVIELVVACVVAGGVALLAVPPSLAILVLGAIWLAGMPNAVNMLDGLDGLAGGVSAIAALGLAALAASSGLLWLSGPALLLAGVSIGFLPFNWPKARVFMGDSGSLFVGGALGVLGMGFVASTPPDVAVAAGIVAGLPILDAAVTLARRLRARRPLMASDLNHMYNFAAVRLGSADRAVVLDWAAGAACAVAAYAWVAAPDWRVAIAAVLATGAGAMVAVSAPASTGGAATGEPTAG